MGPDTGSPWQSLTCPGLWLAGCGRQHVSAALLSGQEKESVLNISKDVTSESHLTFDKAQVPVA